MLLLYSLMAIFSAVASKPKKVFNIEFSGLLKASPLWVLWMDTVDTIFVNLHSSRETFVPSLNMKCPSPEILGVPLPEQQIVHPHQLLQQVWGLHIELGSAVDHVHSLVSGQV